MTAKPNAIPESEAVRSNRAVPESKAVQTGKTARPRAKKRVVRQPRLAWSVRRIHPAVGFFGLYAVAVGLARAVVTLSPGPSEVPRDSYTWTVLIAAGAAVTWLGALAVYARCASTHLRPWRLAIVAWLAAAAGTAWLLTARAGFISRLAFRTIQHMLPFYVRPVPPPDRAGRPATFPKPRPAFPNP